MAFYPSWQPLCNSKPFNGRIPPLAMLAGGALMMAASAAQIAGSSLDLCLSILGGIGISLAAWCNGRRSGNFHLIHHVIRFMLTVLLVVGFALL